MPNSNSFTWWVQAASFCYFKGCPERQRCPYLDLPDKPDTGDRPSVPTPSPSLTQTQVSCSLQANTEPLRALGGGCWEDTRAAHASAQGTQIKSPMVRPHRQLCHLVGQDWVSLAKMWKTNAEKYFQTLLFIHSPLDSLVMGTPSTVTDINDRHHVCKFCQTDLTPSALT